MARRSTNLLKFVEQLSVIYRKFFIIGSESCLSPKAHFSHRGHRVKKNLLSVTPVLSMAKNILPGNGKILAIGNYVCFKTALETKTTCGGTCNM
jgi:hypothetical protein